MTLNEICSRYAAEDAKINIKIIQDDGEGSPTVLVECTREGLKMMSEVFGLLAESHKEKDFSISPDGAGAVFFTVEAQAGIYINRR